MSISHGHRPYVYSDFTPELSSADYIEGIKLKQNLYDQGVATIQSRMDQLAGFDIARDVDRAYANQELSKIYSIIQEKSQNADFSNPYAIKSFLDVTKPLSKDPYFNNAINSTIELRNRQNTLKSIMEKNPDKYSAANAWEYMRDVEDWSNNPNPGAVLNSKMYTPYRDLSKKIGDIVSHVKADTEQQYRTNGKYITAQELETITQSKIKDAVMSQLSADDLNQLRIDSDFNIKDLSPDEKYSKVYSTYETIARDAYNTANDMSKTEDERQQARMTYQAASETIQEINSSNDPKLLDRTLSNIYISDFMNGIGRAYSYQSIKQTMQADPYGLESVRFAHSKQMEEIRRQNDLDKMVLTGEAIKNADGTYSNNPNYKAKGSGKETEDNFYIFDEGMISKSEEPFDVKAANDAILRGELNKTVSFDLMSPAVKYRAEAYVKAALGEEASKQIASIRFVPSSTTVGSDYAFSNARFELGRGLPDFLPTSSPMYATNSTTVRSQNFEMLDADGNVLATVNGRDMFNDQSTPTTTGISSNSPDDDGSYDWKGTFTIPAS